mmetsp:Transcript_60942/g.170458  ORF Transcript_60942/g.170458 Transcript_60942/m.170458 type:complete len:356 (-) Transcript_60942:72-1139(-)|eukprot:CAMPEP_0117518020 /NCGR_PEP_ID=MMETSP0784-20121206/31913_1 /TAXON_ID=39447 /ORGANISM="" /LENGTH=355 /DNA_ID=CAMNT_0005313921 /DNA_START=61 /DNA_END=1128 /DNA_ORIENTATION=-
MRCAWVLAVAVAIAAPGACAAALRASRPHHSTRRLAQGATKLPPIDDSGDEAGTEGVEEETDGEASPQGDEEAEVFSPVVLNNNLGGQGPEMDWHFMSLVYGNMAKTGNDEVPVSLVMINTTAYTAGDPNANGMIENAAGSPLQVINVMSGTNVSIHGIFVSSKTGQKVSLNAFSLVVYGMDCNTDFSGTQQVIAKGFASYQVSEATSLKVEHMRDGRMSFLATADAQDHTPPADVLALSDFESSGSVAIVYRHASEFSITLQVKGEAAYPFPPGRNFVFSVMPRVVTSVEPLPPPELPSVSKPKSPTSADSKGGTSRKSLIIFVVLFPLLMLCCIVTVFLCWAGSLKMPSAWRG